MGGCNSCLLGANSGASERSGQETDNRKAELLHRIETDREVLLDFFRRFIRCPSPNPPGDTRETAGHIRKLLARHGVDCRVIAPNEAIPNIVATFAAGKPGVISLNGRKTRGAANSSTVASMGAAPAT